MSFPEITELPPNVRVTSEEHEKYGGGTATDWFIEVDGVRERNYYDSAEAATRYVLRGAETAEADARVEAVIGQTRHYGIVVRSEPDSRREGGFRWLLTDPFTKDKNYALAWYSASPPPVSVYTREQYEQACGAVGFDPAADTDLGNYADKFGDFSMPHYSAKAAFVFTLRGRRIAGLKREAAKAQEVREQSLAAAGLAEGPYTREQYEQACSILGVRPLTDGGCLAVVEQDLERYSASGVLVIGVPTDALTVKLAYGRATEMETAAAEAGRFCDECGVTIVGVGMLASLGLACAPDCYDAMADRPGKYASRKR